MFGIGAPIFLTKSEIMLSRKIEYCSSIEESLVLRKVLQRNIVECPTMVLERLKANEKRNPEIKKQDITKDNDYSCLGNITMKGYHFWC